MPERSAYPTDLTDAEWAILEPHVPAPKSEAFQPLPRHSNVRHDPI